MKAITSIERKVETDCDADLSWLADERNYLGEPAEDIARYMAEDRARIDAYNRGEWYMLGIRAIARLNIDGILLTIESPGRWGIESDSDGVYFDEVYDEELNTLGDMLHELGFGGSDILEHAPELCNDDPADV